MPGPLPRTKKFKHFICPDGTIRLVTKGQVTPTEDDVVVEDDVRHLPQDWTYDLEGEQFVLIPTGTKTAHQVAGVARAQATEATRTGLITKLQALDANSRDCIVDLASLLGIDLTS